MHYTYDVMLGGGLFVSGNNQGDLGVLLGCVVRVESIGQDLTMSRWMSLARGCDMGIPYEWYLCGGCM